MKCKNCKREIDDDSIFCKWCGQRQIKEAKKEVRVPKPRQLPSGKWFIEMQMDGQRHYITEDTESKCRAVAVALKSGLIEEKKKGPRTTVGQEIDSYIESRSNVLSPSTIAGYKKIRQQNLQSIMALRPDDLTDARMQTAVNQESKTFSPKTIKNAVGLIGAALGRKFPITVAAQPAKAPNTYSSDDIRKLLAAIDGKGEIECAVLLAMWLSLRRSEILALKWEDIGETSITVKAARVYDENHQLVEKTTKTQKSSRVIPCPAYILDRINALPRSREYVFTHGTHYFWESLANICERNGLPHIYLHGLRHTNASVMGLLGIDNKYAMKRGGWTSDHTMKGVYQQIMEEGEITAANRIDEYFLALTPNEIPNKSEKP